MEFLRHSPRRRLVGGAVLSCLISACGGAGPTAATPLPVQVAGAWSSSQTVTSLTGGDCVGADKQAGIGSVVRETLQLTQNGEVLTGTSTSDTNSLTCTYTGTAGPTSITLNLVSCGLGGGLFECRNGQVRDLRLQGQVITATVIGGGMTGTVVETWRVSSSTGASLSPMVLSGPFTASKR